MQSGPAPIYSFLPPETAVDDCRFNAWRDAGRQPRIYFNKHHEKYDTEFGDIVRPDLLAAADYPMVAPLLRRGDESTPLKEIVYQAKRISRSPQLSTDAKCIFFRYIPDFA